MQIPQLNDQDFKIWVSEDIDHKTALNHKLLFALIDGKPAAILHHDHLAEGLNHLARLGLNIAIYQSDKESFERLKSRFLELQTDSDFGEITNDSDELIEAESDLLAFIQSAQELLSNEASAPIIKLVNSLLFQAIKKEASDIHIESHERKGIVRFRIDGALKKHLELDRRITRLVINRIKVISALDISEKRLPQDGRTQVSISGKTLDVRVSILPTYHGERVVMRILMQSDQIPRLEELGFSPTLTRSFYRLLSRSHGMILVTGPTGSGKSTTLHSFLQSLNTPDKNLITIEDPVEYNAENINQIQVNEKVGLTFASGLRSILRQDPDVVMVGEIRDEETAQIAVQASLTGHLMLSTLHTNDSTSALTRLMDMGIKSYLLTSTLLAVLAQRLVRRLCPECKVPRRLDPAKALEVRLDPDKEIFRARGCAKCDFSGYRGRQAVGELFIIDDEVKKMIDQGLNDHEIRQHLKAGGMLTISDQLRELVNNGSTSFEEALRVGLMDG